MLAVVRIIFIAPMIKRFAKLLDIITDLSVREVIVKKINHLQQVFDILIIITIWKGLCLLKKSLGLPLYFLHCH